MEESFNEHIQQITQLRAENESLKSQLQIFADVLDAKNRDLETLECRLSGASSLKSSFDNQIEELSDLQEHIDILKNKLLNPEVRNSILSNQSSQSSSLENQLYDLQAKYAQLLSDLANMKLQLQNLQIKNTILQQQNAKVGELESLLANKHNAE